MSTSQTIELSAAQLRDSRDQRDHRQDRWFRIGVMGCALFVLIVLLGAALSMLWGGWEAFSTFGWRFLWSSDWGVYDNGAIYWSDGRVWVR